MSSRRHVKSKAGAPEPVEAVPVDRLMLGRDAILGAADLKIQKVLLPEWGGHVFVRGMTGAERDQYDSSVMVGIGRVSTKDLHARLATFTVCDETGKLLFRPGDPEDIKALTEKSAVALHRIFLVGQRLSGMHLELDEITQILKNARPSSSPTA
jgi:hypothetical protein